MIVALGLTLAAAVSAAPGSTETPEPSIVINGPPIDRNLFTPVGIALTRHANTEALAYASAFLISKCYAVTARRVFEDEPEVIGKWLEFWAGVRGDVSGWTGSRAQVVADGALSSIGEDWILLRLDKCLGKNFGWVKLDRSYPKYDAPYVLASYPTDIDYWNGIQVNRRCRIRTMVGALARHDCVLHIGESGSPLFRIEERNGRKHLVVVAMMTSSQRPPRGIPGQYNRRFNGQVADLAIPAALLASHPQIAAVAAKSGHR